MNWSVLKIGGSILKSTTSFLDAIDVIEQKYPRQTAVIVSAFFGVTDLLEQQLIKKEAGQTIEESFYLYLEKLHLNQLKAINTNIKEFELKIIALIKAIRKELTADFNLETKRDRIMAYGEKLAVIVFEAALKARKIDCSILWPEEGNLIVQETVNEVTVDLEQSAHNIKPYFKKPHLILIPGFYGVNHQQQIRLLGRGGSDYTATCLANCLNATEVDLWKDVKGIASANPKIIAQTQKVESLTYNEAATLANFGSEILHPLTCEPAQAKNIKINIFCLEQKNKPATIIGNINFSSPTIKSVSLEQRHCLFKFKVQGAQNSAIYFSKIQSYFAQNKVEIKAAQISEATITIITKHCFYHEVLKMLTEKCFINLKLINKTPNLALIALVGEGINLAWNQIQLSLQSLWRDGISILTLIEDIASAVLIVGVDQKNCLQALKVLHQEIFTTRRVQYLENLV